MGEAVLIFQQNIPVYLVARVSSHVDDFNTRNKVLTAKLLRHRYIDIIKFVRRFQNFIGGILT